MDRLRVRRAPAFEPLAALAPGGAQADCVLLAIGQGPDVAYAGRALQTERGLLAVTGETQATRYADVYAGGDAVTGAATVVAALAAGRRAAAAIDGALGGPRAAARAGAAAPVSIQVNTQALAPTPRVRATTRPPAARTIDAEDVATLDREATLAEARRCVNCGCVAVNAADLAPALLALEARIVTTTRTLAARDFFAARLMSTTVLAPGELVTHVVIPAPPPGSVQRYRKFRLRHAIDFPIVGVATVLTVSRGKIVAARVALGAVAPVPVRARAVEEFLRGQPLTEETAAVAGAIAVRGVQPLGKNAFKVQIVRALLRQAILEAAQGR